MPNNKMLPHLSSNCFFLKETLANDQLFTEIAKLTSIAFLIALTAYGCVSEQRFLPAADVILGWIALPQIPYGPQRKFWSIWRRFTFDTITVYYCGESAPQNACQGQVAVRQSTG